MYHILDMIKSDRNSSKSRFDNLQNFWRVDCIMYGETILDMIKSDRNSSKSRFTDNLQNFWRVDCVMYGDTTRGDCRNCRNIFRQLAGAGFGGTLLLVMTLQTNTIGLLNPMFHLRLEGP